MKDPLLPVTEIEGFVFDTTALLPTGGTGFLVAPDGTRAGIQWDVAESPYIMRVEPPGQEHWGVYRVGFTTPVTTTEDLQTNLTPLLGRLKILHRRARQV